MLEEITPYFLAFVLLSIIAEAIYSVVKGKGLYDRKDTWTSMLFGVLGVITRIAFKGLNLAIWFALYSFSPFKIETSLLSVAVLFLLNEFIYYWFHRWSHTVPFLWATHVNHHSSLRMNFSVATRTPFLNAVYHILFWLPLPLLGFQPLDILIVETISFYFAFIQHTTLIPKLGWLEWIFNTPSHHRVHHASNPEYLDKNFGNVLIIYDRLFGTFTKETSEPVYGLVKNPQDRSFINMVFHGWKDLLTSHRRTKRIGRTRNKLQGRGIQ